MRSTGPACPLACGYLVVSVLLVEKTILSVSNGLFFFKIMPFFFNHAFFLFQNNYWLFLSPTLSCAHTCACIHTDTYRHADTHTPAILSWRNGHLHYLREASMQPRALPLIPRILSQTELCFLRPLYVLVHLPVGVFKSFRGRAWRRSRRWHRDPHWRSVFSQLYFQLPSQM